MVCALKPHSNVKSEGDFGQISKYDCLLFEKLDRTRKDWDDQDFGPEPGCSVLTKQI